MASRRQTARTLAAVPALAAAILLPTSADATTIRLGPPVPTSPVSTFFLCEEFCLGTTSAQLVAPGFIVEAPASGLITSWRVAGAGALKLRVLRPAPEDEWIGDGASAAATNVKGEANATSLPIRAGDVIGVDQPLLKGSAIDYREVATDTAQLIQWEPALPDDGPASEPRVESFNEEILLNADVVLAPMVSSLSPASGSTAGGIAVKIAGSFLDGATGVTFGSTPASSFSVDSSSQITAIAPAAGVSTVDVRVTGPGGSSEVGSADRYTFNAPATTTSATTTTTPVTATSTAPRTFLQASPELTAPTPAVTGFSESAAKWRRGRSLPHISSTGGTPVGTTFSFGLNEQATVTFTFTQSVPGRRAHGSCVAPSPGNAHRPSCKRTVLVGSFGALDSTGLHKVGFQGRLSSAKALKPGTYAVSISAHDTRGLKAVSRPLSFTIVP